MKRTVKAWAGLCEGELTRYGQLYDGVYVTRKLARKGYEHVVPCTITYDDGKPPKRTRRGK